MRRCARRRRARARRPPPQRGTGAEDRQRASGCGWCGREQPGRARIREHTGSSTLPARRLIIRPAGPGGHALLDHRRRKSGLRTVSSAVSSCMCRSPGRWPGCSRIEPRTAGPPERSEIDGAVHAGLPAVGSRDVRRTSLARRRSPGPIATVGPTGGSIATRTRLAISSARLSCHVVLAPFVVDGSSPPGRSSHRTVTGRRYRPDRGRAPSQRRPRA